jgi:hypothetical protein
MFDSTLLLLLLFTLKRLCCDKHHSQCGNTRNEYESLWLNPKVNTWIMSILVKKKWVLRMWTEFKCLGFV